MNKLDFLLPLAALGLLCACKQEAPKRHDITITAQRATTNKFRLYAYSESRNGELTQRFESAVWCDTITDTTQWRYSPQPQWTCGNINFYAYITCDGVTHVSSSPQKPLYIEYTTNSNICRRGDLLTACDKITCDSSNVTLKFVHALSRLSFAWTADNEQDPTIKYKLHRLSVRAKQSGRMTYRPEDSEPDWVLVTENGDHMFEVYKCSDYTTEPNKQRFHNPERHVLEEDSSLFLAPGIAVAAEVEYSIWQNGTLTETKTVSNLILGGREHSAALLRYGTHYTYTFIPPTDEHKKMDVKLNIKEWK